MKKTLYVIVYFRNHEFFMVGASCYETRDSAIAVAENFCEGPIDDAFWTFIIEAVEYHS